jgi:nucleoside-diphosphate-sugar epimerase
MCELLSKDQRILFASTGSNYGAVTGDICTEETPLNPISLYGETKTDGEKWLLNHSNAVAYRFATAFGLSLRMRLDLLINDFVYQAINNRYLIMFERSFKRSFIHVDDMARSFLFAIENHDKVESGAYNIGDEQNNYSKEEIALLIKDKVDYYLHFADVGEDKDKRNYEVSYSKFKSLGFKAETSVEEGIDQLIKSMEAFEFIHPYRNA